MFKYYKDYFWKEGKPFGIDEINPSQTASSYKIVSDPYLKRLSIEKYHYQFFDKIIYDSLLLDFRQLSVKDQTAWEREMIKEDEGQSFCLLRNQEDRVILIETLTYESNYCRSCLISSVHHTPLSIHRMYYRELHDPFDGVVLYDMEKHPVMLKMYEINSITREFNQLLYEEWNMKICPSILQT